MTFVWIFAGVGLMLAAWSLATPIGAAPDEPAHIIEASAIVRGQFDEPYHPTPVGPEATVSVPQWTASVRNAQICVTYAASLKATTSRCAALLSDSATLTNADTQFSNYPPLYYVVVGVPSLFLTGSSAVYTMRLTGDLLNAALVALGISLLVRFYPRRTILIGVLLALTPMALYLMAVVSSSGLEISSGFAVWCGGLCVVEQPTVPRALAVWTALATLFLVLSRPESLFDAFLIAVVLVTLVGWRNLRARLNPSLRPLWMPVVAAAALAALLLLVDGTPQLAGVPSAHPASLLSNMWTSLRLTGGYLRQCLGEFGWIYSPTSIPAPTWVVIVWTSLLAVLTGAALLLSASCRRGLPVLALAIIAMPLALEAPQMNVVGNYFQGRYLLPVVVGFPLVAASFHFRARWHWFLPGLMLVVGMLLAAAQVASFDLTLERYETGFGMPAGTPVTWLPFGGRDPVVALFVVGAITTLACVIALNLDRSADSPFGNQAEVSISATEAFRP